MQLEETYTKRSTVRREYERKRFQGDNLWVFMQRKVPWRESTGKETYGGTASGHLWKEKSCKKKLRRKENFSEKVCGHLLKEKLRRKKVRGRKKSTVGKLVNICGKESLRKKT